MVFPRPWKTGLCVSECGNKRNVREGEISTAEIQEITSNAISETKPLSFDTTVMLFIDSWQSLNDDDRVNK